MKKNLQYENHSFDVVTVASKKKDDFIKQHKGDFFPEAEAGRKLAEVWDKCTALAKNPDPALETAPEVKQIPGPLN